MELTPVAPATARAGLRALKMVAFADGELSALERRMLDAVQTHMTHTSFDVDVLEPITPAELASTATDPALRERIVSACVVMSLIDGEPSAVETELIEQFAASLGVTSHALEDVQRLIDGQVTVARIDIARRSFLGQRGRAYLAQNGFGGFASLVRSLLGFENKSLAARYLALADKPRGTLGREYYEFVRANGFALPGERGGAPEVIVFHDCLHVLAQYGTESIEETQIASFQAGVLRKDPVYGLLFMLAQFHVGVQITPVTGAEKLVADPARMLDAFARGSKTTHDLCTDWVPQDDFDRSVEELRRAYNIEPRKSPPADVQPNADAGSPMTS